MPTIDRENKTSLFRIVYYGPGLCGKTTNLQQFFKRLRPEQKLSQEIMEVPTQTDKTLSYEFAPLQYGKVEGSGFDAKYAFYTVPGQVHYKASRKIILNKVDALVFVADSQPEMREENIRTINEMYSFLEEYGRRLEEIPVVLQFNKRDLDNVMTVAQMSADLQRTDEPWFEAAAITGQGVMETAELVTKMVRSIKPSV